MPRGGHKVRPAKVAQVDTPVPSDIPGRLPTIEKIKRTNTDWKSLLSRSSTTTKFPDPVPEQPPTPTLPNTFHEWTPNIDLPVRSVEIPTGLKCDEGQDATPENLPTELAPHVQPGLQSTAEEEDGEGEHDSYKADLDTFGYPSADSFVSGASSSIYSRSSASIYSRASSIYSSEASIYSFDDGGPDEFDRYAQTDLTSNSGAPNVLRLQQAARAVTLRQREAQDASYRERSTLAKKAALFKNSRLPPQLPSFSTSLPTWSMVCRAAKASQDCYDSHASTRRGVYVPADSSKDVKAMIVDEQLIDDLRVILVSIRGTQSQSLSDWTVNTTGNPTKPVGFLDDEENACHAGFLRVAKAMVGHVAAHLQQYVSSPERPTLLFTGHSAGGATAAMLYSHMVSTTMDSELTALVPQFSSVNCVTFGAPPISQTPLSQRDHIPGIFLAFANEGDLVLRTSNAAYFKSLAKLMAASPPPSTTAAVAPPPVKVVRGSRGATVYRQALPTPSIPWEDLPLWPTPAPSLTNAGDIVLLRDRGENGGAVASSITSEDLKEVIFGDLAQHTIEMYLRRVKDLALAAMLGREM